jgi:hypothetical protein
MSNDELECEIDSLRDDVENVTELALLLLVGRHVRTTGDRNARVTNVFPGTLKPIEVTYPDGKTERGDLSRIHSVVPLGENE